MEYKEEVIAAVKTRLRDHTAPLPQYLVSRSLAGAAHVDLINAVELATSGSIVGKFFHFFPERNVDVAEWLGEWISAGAVPVATLNLQRGQDDGSVPDAWHHQMICGVSGKGVHVCNPNEVIPFHVFQQQISSDSVLLVRRQDVFNRWGHGTEDYTVFDNDVRWQDMKVVEQILKVVREELLTVFRVVVEPNTSDNTQSTSHISIPACYKSGVSLFVSKHSPAYEQLMSSNELPLKNS